MSEFLQKINVSDVVFVSGICVFVLLCVCVCEKLYVWYCNRQTVATEFLIGEMTSTSAIHVAHCEQYLRQLLQIQHFLLVEQRQKTVFVATAYCASICAAPFLCNSVFYCSLGDALLCAQLLVISFVLIRAASALPTFGNINLRLSAIETNKLNAFAGLLEK